MTVQQSATDRRIVTTMCPMNCHPTYCGMRVTLEDGRVVRTAGDPDNPDSRGFLCIRGRATQEIVGNPRRFTRPLRRVGPRGSDTWEPISWAAALDQIVAAIRQAGRERVGVHSGHGVLVNTIDFFAVRRLGYLGGFQYWNPAIICWTLGAYGLQLTGVLEANTKEDIGAHSQTILLWGSSVTSQPSTVPHLVAARRRGACVVGIDVRKNETSQHADRFLVIKPATDAALALGMMHVLFDEGLVDRDFLAMHTVGAEALAEHVQRYTPEWAARTTGLDADVVRWLARQYARQRPSMIVMGGSSLFKHRNGWQSSRAISCLPAIIGQLGVPGGGLGPRHRAFSHGEGLRDIGGQSDRPPGDYIPGYMPSIGGALNEGRIDVLLLFGTNMVSSFPNSGALAEGLDRVGLIVAHDLFSNATIRQHADIVLPSASWLEEVGVKETATQIYLMDRFLEPEGESRSAADVVAELAGRLDLPDVFPWPDQEAAVDALLAGLDDGSLTVERLRQTGGRYTRRVSHVAYPDHRYPTPSGKVELYSARAATAGLPPLPVYDPPEDRVDRDADGSSYPLEFRQGRTFASFHSFYDEGQALPSLARVNPAPEVWLNPLDAGAREIRQGDAVELFNRQGAGRALARVTDDVPPGVVWMRDGWLLVNRLTSDEPTLSVDASNAFSIPGGQSAFDARVDVRRAPADRGVPA